MMMRVLRFAILAGGLIVAACTSGPDIRVDRDPASNPARYQSFAFFPHLGTDREGYSSLLSDRLKAATRSELERRGYRYDENQPELLVNFGARAQEKTKVTTSPSMGMGAGYGYYGYRVGLYGGWPGYTDVNVDQYKEGTLNVDLVDAARKKLIWQSVAVGRITKSDLRDLDRKIPEVIAQMFAPLPARDGVEKPAP